MSARIENKTILTLQIRLFFFFIKNQNLEKNKQELKTFQQCISWKINLLEKKNCIISMKHLYTKIRKKVEINKTYEQGNIEFLLNQ